MLLAYMISVPGVFSAGDMRRGQSLVVWAIRESRNAACGIGRCLMGESRRPFLFCAVAFCYDGDTRLV